MVARGCGSTQALVCLTPPLAQLQHEYLHCPFTGQNECWDTEPLVLLLGPILDRSILQPPLRRIGQLQFLVSSGANDLRDLFSGS